MIKRVIKFIPKAEYSKIYDALFKSHMTYCISSWGAIPSSKLQKIFSIQKRCIRLLFGSQYSFDHAGYYKTCARARSFADHMSDKQFCLEHTKPLFNKYKLLTLHNLHVYHTFLDIFKILKTHVPISLYLLFTHGQRDNLMLKLPYVSLEISRNNFVFKSSSIWNNLIENIFEKNEPSENGMIINGSTINSDFCATVPFIKNKLKTLLLSKQALGDEINWVKENSVLL